MDIGLALRVALARRNKTQAWLAEQLGTSEGYISNMKRGTMPSVERMQAVAGLLGFKLSEFVALGEEE